MVIQQFTRAIAIVPSDAVSPAIAVRGIYVGGAGDIVVRMPGDSADVTFKAVPVGTTLYISPKLVKATGTTATLMIGLG